MRRMSLVIIFVLVVSLVAPAAASAAPAQSGGFWHQVQHRQTVFAIGRLYGVSPYAIASANGLANWNIIYVGQWLWIPGGPYKPYPYPRPYPYPYPYGCARSHYVSPGETLLGIARWYGRSAWSIAAANNIYNLNRIYAGQWLCIP
ncbi:MAG: LysM peptidoglycan-binding domain-containing protein [Longimicrobiales bacterium]